MQNSTKMKNKQGQHIGKYLPLNMCYPVLDTFSKTNPFKLILIWAVLVEFWQLAIPKNSCKILPSTCLIFAQLIILSWSPSGFLANKMNQLIITVEPMDTENWTIDEGSFELISSLYNPFTLDRFADNLTIKWRILILRIIALGYYMLMLSLTIK